MDSILTCVTVPAHVVTLELKNSIVEYTFMNIGLIKMFLDEHIR